MFEGESSDEFARIDLVSNHTVFRDPEHYHALLRGQDLPVETFSSFIHEATHHWCFISPVGTALSFLYLSAAKRILRWLAKHDDSLLNQALDDLCTFEIAVKFLRPLNEGLAQFAEYDVLPSESSDLISPPLLATLGHLFNLQRRLDVKPEDWPEASYAVMDDIMRWRVSRRTIERKGELLLQPMDADGSAYLLGYLTVKQIWKSASRFYDELKSADVFLMFMRKLIFSDYALVAELLNRQRPAPQRALGFAKGLHDRLHAIRQLLFDEDIPWSEWAKLLAAIPQDEVGGLQIADPTPFSALDTAKAVKKGLELQRKRFREVADLEVFESKDVPLNIPPDIFLDVVRERYLMWLGQVPGRWESTGNKRGRIRVGGEILYDNYELTEASDKGLDELTLDIYIDLYRGFQLTTIGNERGVFGFATRNTIGERAQQDLLKTRLDRSRIVRTIGALQHMMHSALGMTNYRQVLSDFWTAEVRDLLNQTYLGFALNFDEQAQKLFVERGLADVLDNDGDLVRNVAAISLGASAELSPEGLVSMSDAVLNPVDTVQRVARLWPIKDFPLATIGTDGFLSSAV